MEYRTVEYVNKPVSKIVFGCSNPVITHQGFFKEKKAFGLLDAALAAGINTFDTAEAYGTSESVLGKWMQKRKNRSQVVLITKGCHPHGGPRVNSECLKQDLEQSMKRLKTEYIDIYMLHRDQQEADVNAIIELLNQYHREGKIGAFGASNWTHERIAQVNQYAAERGLIGFTVSSPNFGFARQVNDPWGGGCVSISGPENKRAREWYGEQGISVFAYSCLGRGLFSGKVRSNDPEQAKRLLDTAAIRGYWCAENLELLARVEKIAEEKHCSIAQLSLAWIMQQKFTAFPIVTISDEKRIAENVAAVDIKLSEKECTELTDWAGG